ncbi:hypothetical protein [Cupriavidus pauculus]|uniref:Uncharacterized protein n=1 Tax=Cupriavidus pauculus TaxID=82633 RepID=A0A2N5C7U9_9BURK|nr:hypothetical protein [Cupriavidus pauculus]PLP98296.1 hypothetical protein CYJ10_22605 [Cupriavidus pauculus]
MSSKPNTGKQAEKRGGANPSVRTDRRADQLKSRSADPGESSYGGFRNEDPGAQHQATSTSPGKRPKKGHGS